MARHAVSLDLVQALSADAAKEPRAILTPEGWDNDSDVTFR